MCQSNVWSPHNAAIAVIFKTGRNGKFDNNACEHKLPFHKSDHFTFVKWHRVSFTVG